MLLGVQRHHISYFLQSLKVFALFPDYKIGIHYGEESIWLTGLPVFDSLQNNDRRYIVIAPTWRKELMVQQWKEERLEMVSEILCIVPKWILHKSITL